MKPPEAIENLKEEAEFEKQHENQMMVDSIKLGIEALILYERCRNTQPVWLPALLPGETEGD